MTDGVVITEEPIRGDAQLEFDANVTALLGTLTNEVKDLRARVEKLEKFMDEIEEAVA